MIKCGPDLSVNPACIASLRLETDERLPAKLHIHLTTGETHVLKDSARRLGGVDVYQVKLQIEAALIAPAKRK